MKKLIIVLSLFIPLVSFALSVSPNPPHSGAPATYTLSSSNAYLGIWDDSNLLSPFSDHYCASAICTVTLPSGTFHVIEMLSPFSVADTGSSDYYTILASGYKVANISFTTLYQKPAIDQMLENATSTFNTMLGFTPAQGVKSAGEMFTMPIIGGGLALLVALKYWIIALVVLSAIVYFAYRAFRFYKH